MAATVALVHGAWRDVPSTYGLCTKDQAIPRGMQRAFARTRHVVDWPAGHSPFFSRPDLVAALLAARARAGT